MVLSCRMCGAGFVSAALVASALAAPAYGDRCRKVLENQAGDFIYIEPGVPHEVFNLSDSEPVVAVIARSDATEWENIVAYDRNK